MQISDTVKYSPVATAPPFRARGPFLDACAHLPHQSTAEDGAGAAIEEGQDAPAAHTPCGAVGATIGGGNLSTAAESAQRKGEEGEGSALTPREDRPPDTTGDEAL